LTKAYISKFVTAINLLTLYSGSTRTDYQLDTKVVHNATA